MVQQMAKNQGLEEFAAAVHLEERIFQKKPEQSVAELHRPVYFGNVPRGVGAQKLHVGGGFDSLDQQDPHGNNVLRSCAANKPAVRVHSAV